MLPISHPSAASARQRVPETPANTVEADGTTALHRAAQRNDLELAAQLIRAGANVKAANRYGVTPLSLACINGNAAMISLILEAGANANTTLPEGETALMTASNTGHVDALKVLLAHGANVNARENSRGQTALMWAVNEGYTAAAQLLIDAGADINAQSNGKFSPMMFAVRGGHIDIVRLLLARGASATETVAAAENTSLLGFAILNGKYNIGHLLLKHGADPNAPDPRGSLLHTIAWMRRPGSARDFRRSVPPHPKPVGDSLELVEDLLARGANPNARIAWKEIPWTLEEGETKTPPGYSAAARSFIIMTGATPFFLAAKDGDVALMRTLVANGADPRIANVHGVTPAMAAAGLGFWEGESPSPLNGMTSEAERLEAVKLAYELSGEDVNYVADYGGNVEFDEDGETLLFDYPRKYSFDPARPTRPEAMMGDMRWAGSTALHGAAILGHESIVRFLVEKGARLDVRNKAGWTPLMVTQGMLLSANARFFPKTEALLKTLMIERGLDPADYSQRAVKNTVARQPVER
jgi:ankyrin repeat protein